MLKTYCINLDHRSDRWQEALRNYRDFGLAPESVTRWPAVADSEFGALGCAKSHVAVLSHFLTRESAQYCLVLEDDFDFVRPWNEFVESFNRLGAERIEWDALALVGTRATAYESSAAGFARLVESCCTAGYLVKRQYAARLLGCFAETIPQMEAMRHVASRLFVIERFSIDVQWQRLQRQDRWYIGMPSFGHQRPSYSDVERQYVDKDSETYGLHLSSR